MIRTHWLVLFAAFMLLTITAQPSLAQAITFNTIAITGMSAPGTSGLTYGTSFGYTGLNSAGQVVFFGRLAGTGVTNDNDFGFWSEGGGTGLALVAREGSAAPGIPAGITFLSVDTQIVLNSAGQTAFSASLTGPGITTDNGNGIWSQGGGAGLALVARAGSAAPGTPAGVNFGSTFFNPLLNGSGQVAFLASVAGTGVTFDNNTGIWSQGGGTGLELVARKGSAAPGTSAGVNFNGFGGALAFNGAGQVAFLSSLTGTGVTSGVNDSGIWSQGGGGGLALVAREGSPAPGLAGVNYGDFAIPVLNNAGQVAFFSLLTGAGVTTANDRAIWSQGGGAGLTLVAREGSAAPGTAAGVNFGTFQSNVLINGAGQVAFFADLTGSGVTTNNDIGIWSQGGGAGLALVSREGSAAPGTPLGVNFGSSIFTPVLNGTGQLAFFASLAGTGVTTNNDGGIWVMDRLGLRLVVREGDLFNVNPTGVPDMRTISNVSLTLGTGGEDGRATSLNDSGLLTYTLTFTNSTAGVFTAQTAAIPEPSTLLGITAAGLALARLRRRQRKTS